MTSSFQANVHRLRTLLARHRHPLIEAIGRDQTAASGDPAAEHRPFEQRLGLRVDLGLVRGGASHPEGLEAQPHDVEGRAVRRADHHRQALRRGDTEARRDVNFAERPELEPLRESGRIGETAQRAIARELGLSRLTIPKYDAPAGSATWRAVKSRGRYGMVQVRTSNEIVWVRPLTRRLSVASFLV